MRRVLVTGGAGFIGSNLCRHLVQTGDFCVLNIDKLSYASNLASLDTIAKNDRYSFIQADICDTPVIARAFDDFKPDAVMHLAAESHVDRSIAKSGDFIQSNVVGTHSLLTAALDYWDRLSIGAKQDFRFLHISTDEVYGSLGTTGSFTESTAYDPSSPYSASKAASDHLVVAWHRTYGLPTIISNCSNNYGPFQFPEKLIPLMILNGREGRALPIYGDGSNVRDWLHVFDHVDALVSILNQGLPGETYNIGGGSELSNLKLVQSICDLLDEFQPSGAPHRNLISFVEDRPGHDHRYSIDSAKIRKQLGWEPSRDFAFGLRDTITWYLNNLDWWRPLRQNVYSGERLGLREHGGDGA